MDESVFTAIVLVIMFAIFPIVFIAIMYYSTVRTREKMRAAAVRLGLAYEDGEAALRAKLAATERDGGGPDAAQLANLNRSLQGDSLIGKIVRFMAPWRISGTMHGRAVTIEPFTRGSGKSSQAYTRVSVFYHNPLGIELQVGPEGFFDRLLRPVFSGQDIQLGDESADSQLMIRGASESAVRSALAAPQARAAIIALTSNYMYAAALDDRAVAELRGTISDEKKLRAMLDAAHAVAEALDRGGSRF